MKLLTFLGTGLYQNTRYQWQDYPTFETPFFTEALNKWLQPEEIYLLRTPDTQRKRTSHLSGEVIASNWELIFERLPNLCPVDIPNGMNEDELWEIFDAITQCFHQGDEVIIDVTHAFRSLPILSIMAMSYLRQVKEIKLHRIVYGAYEAKYEKNGQIYAPTFDLTPFVDLFDWTHAAHQFMVTGQASELASLLKKQYVRLSEEDSRLFKAGLRPEKTAPKVLKKTAENLEQITDALMLSRPQALADSSEKFKSQVQDIHLQYNDLPKPFQIILRETAERYAEFNLNNLQTERQLIVWYHKHGHFVQALTLMREWLVSVVCVKMKFDRLEERHRAEEILNNAIYGEGELISQSDLSMLENWSNYVDIWNGLSDLRNDVAHCGQRPTPLSTANIKKQIQKKLFAICKLELPGDRKES